MTLKAAGYVITNAEAIWGIGKTQQEAWMDFERGMAAANVEVMDAKPESDDGWSPPVAVRDDFSCEPATQALLDQIAEGGGNQSWRYDGDVACTSDEEPE